MPRNRFVSTSVIVVIAAWLVAIPAVYLLLDFWIHGVNGAIMRHIWLRPYGLYIGTCPFLLSWIGCIFAAVVAIRGAKKNPSAPGPESPRLLGTIALVVSLIGTIAGALLGLPLMFLLFLAVVTGHMYVRDALVLLLLAIGMFFGLRYGLRRLAHTETDRPAL